ncbi:MAG TPA: diguanylate cyclase response regulator [Actinobacteria bacterium]|nr:diguanylate cyclase response regulator [Actinomycetota bacterium]
MVDDNVFKEKIPLILIVDDIAKNLQVLGTVLSKKNYKIAAANNGEQAISIANNTLPDLILLDIMMPGINGYEVCARLKKDPKTKDIPIIFLTAKIELDDIVKGFETGAVDYIAKPFNSVELLVRTKTHLELKISRDLLKIKNEQLKKLSITDSMTGLYNHRYIIDSLSERIAEAKRYKQPLSIIMFDIDYFKKVNDNYGHTFGDYVLVRISTIIEESVRKTDIAGRYGGEEYLIIFTNTDIKNAYKTSERLRKSIEKEKWEKAGLAVTVSGGICELKDEDCPKLIMKADNLLYKAKKNNRNRIEML